MRYAGALVGLVVLGTASLAFGQDKVKAVDPAPTDSSWPQWRGPDRDGISKVGGWSLEGAEAPLWKANVGIGYSTVSIAGGRLYTAGHDKESQEDTVFCFDAESGEELWKHTFPCKTLAKYHIGGSLTTPTVDGDQVYAASRFGKFFCFDAKTGKVKWEKDLKKQFNAKVPIWGLSASPLLLGDKIIMNVGRVVAFSRSGKVIWKTKRDYGHAYSTPADMKIGNRTCLAVFNGSGLVLIDAKNGKAVSNTQAWKTKYDVNAATPVPCGDKIFVSSGYNHGCAMVDVAGKGKKLSIAWENKSMRNHMSGCVLYGDHLYGFDEGVLKCLALDGEVQWSKRGLGKGALVLADGKIVALSQRGDLVIAKATPDGFEGLYRKKVLRGGVCWTTPVVHGGLIYCRNSLGNLVCLDHRGDSK